jgi:hypothetical protein
VAVVLLAVPDVAATDRDRHVGVDRVLLGLRLHVGVLIDDGVLTTATILVDLRVVLGLGVRLVLEELDHGAVAAPDVAAADGHPHVGVDRVLLGLRLRVGVLIDFGALIAAAGG